MNKIGSILGALAFMGGLIYLGVMAFSGDLSGGGRRGRLLVSIVNAIAGAIGHTATGALLVGVGVLGGGYMLVSAIRGDDEEDSP